MRANKADIITPIVIIAKMNDAEKVKTAIYKKYGFWVTDEYALDLIAFVNTLDRE